VLGVTHESKCLIDERASQCSTVATNLSYSRLASIRFKSNPDGKERVYKILLYFVYGYYETIHKSFLNTVENGNPSNFLNLWKFEPYPFCFARGGISIKAMTMAREVVNEDGELLGKLVTLYGHIDLDLNEANGLSLDGKEIRKGELVSRHLYSGTMGGPHLHFEIRYYRPDDVGDENFYGLSKSGSDNAEFSVASAGPWSLGNWYPNIGYGYADPYNHGIAYEE